MNMAAPLAFVERGKVAHLGIAKDLNTHGIEILVVACQQQARPVYVRCVDGDIFQLRRRINNL